jgi:phosphoribosylaminoimidazole (AIR) synthetase
MVVVAPSDQADDIIQRLKGLGERGYQIGVIEPKEEHEPSLLLEPGFLSDA